MKSVRDVIQEIADETRLFDSWTDDETKVRTFLAMRLIEKFEYGIVETTSLELGKACFLLLTLSNNFANYKHWETIEDLFSGVNAKQYKLAVLAIRDDYLKNSM